MTREDERFEQWLDEAARDAARTSPRAPFGFTDRVLAQVALEPRTAAAPSWTRTLPASVGSDPLPWWTRVFAQPACALGFLVVGVAFLWRGTLAQSPEVVTGLVSRAFAALAPFWGPVVEPFARLSAMPGGEVCVLLALLPFAGLLSYGCYAATAALAHHAPARRIGT